MSHHGFFVPRKVHIGKSLVSAAPSLRIAPRGGLVCRLTFELSGSQRQGARPGPVKMYGVPPARAWWPAVGAPLERGVRHHWAPGGGELHFLFALTFFGGNAATYCTHHWTQAFRAWSSRKPGGST
jgi:hypothetical protein